MDDSSHIGASTDDRLRAAVEEYAGLLRRDEAPPVGEFVEGHPDLAEPLLGMLSVLHLFGESYGTVDPAVADPLLAGVGQPRADSEPCRLGDHRLVRKIGQGGMGIVYEAVEESLGRRVALKLLPAIGPLDERRIERFQREARAAATLHHGNIVPVFGLREHEGRYFYTMQYIEGRGLDRVILDLRDESEKETAPDSGRATSRSRDRERFVAEVGVQVAGALEHAHGRGVLHRDIKPSNVILDERGNAWVTDFGLAKLEGSGDLTETGEILGTCRFMAPERFDGEADREGDVYSLGLTLYELLTLEPAFESTSRARLVERILEGRPARPRKLLPDVSRDLENIVLRAIERHPRNRYRSAGELGADLFCFLHGRPVQARPVGALVHAKRWCRRNPVMASLAGLVTILVVTVAIVSTLAATRLRAQLRETHLSDARAARWSARPGCRWRSLASIARAAAIRPGVDLRDEVVASLHLTDLEPAGPPLELPFPIRKSWVDRQLSRVALLAADGSVRVHALESGAELLRVAEVSTAPNRTFPSLSPSGDLLAISSFERLALWDVDEGESLLEWFVPVNGGRVYPHPTHAAFAFCSGHEVVVVDGRRGDFRTLSLAGAALPRESQRPRQVSWSPDERHASITYALGSTVLIVDMADGSVVRRLTERGVRWTSWHASGRYLAMASGLHPRSRVAIWDATTGERLNWIDGPEVTIDRVSFLGDWHLVGDTWSGHGFVWDFRTGLLALRPPAQRTFVSGDGRRAALWRGKTIGVSELLPSAARILLRDVQRPDHEWATLHPRWPLVVAGSTGLVFDTRDGRLLARLPIEGSSCGVFDSEGGRFVTGGVDDGIRVWSVSGVVDGGRLEVGFVGPRDVSRAPTLRAALAADDRSLFVENSKSLSRIDLESGEVTEILDARSSIARLAVSPDGRWVAMGSGGDSSDVRIWDARSNQVVRLEAVDGRHHPAFSPDGRLLVVNTPTSYHFFEVGTWRPTRSIECESSNGIGATAMTRDGRLLAYKDGRSSIRILDLARDRELTRLEAPDGVSISTATFSSSGDALCAYPCVWSIRRLRGLLRDLDLDWDPPMPPPEIPADVSIRVRVGSPASRSPSPAAAPPSDGERSPPEG